MGSKNRSPQPPAAAPAGGCGGGEVSGDVGASDGKGPAPVVPKPPEVAPFLAKVYDMVSDPATDKVISWSKGGGSFVVWYSHTFERDLISRNFKHSNFTSFIRQLNTYGFRKVDPDRWEWANEGFIRDQKDLLKTIKRKKKSSQEAPSELKQAPVKTAPGTENMETRKYGGLGKEIETLKRDKALLMQQLVDLSHHQQTSNLEVQKLIQRLQVMEQNQQQMMALLAIVVQNPSFLNQLVQQQQRRSNWWNVDANKKRRFHALEQGPATDQETSSGGAQIIEYQRPAPETSSQVMPVDGAFCSATTQAVPSPALAMPMDILTTSNNLNTLGSSGELFTDTSALQEWDDNDMQLLFDDDLNHILPPFENDGQLDLPLSIQDYDYPQIEQDCQMEARHSCKNPQYADVITEA